MASATYTGHGLAMLQAASVALSEDKPSDSPPTPSSVSTRGEKQPMKHPTKPEIQYQSKPSCASVSALLNPAPADMAAALPPGFVLGKDGKVKKKRGRKPTPGLTDEDRRQARLLKNRRTAETSRRRKLALMNRLTTERDDAKLLADRLKKHNHYLTQRLAKALGRSVDDLLEKEPDVLFRHFEHNTQSDVSTPTTTTNSESDGSVKKP